MSEFRGVGSGQNQYFEEKILIKGMYPANMQGTFFPCEQTLILMPCVVKASQFLHTPRPANILIISGRCKDLIISKNWADGFKK